ncbi:MAG: alpha/beta fold hydrolase [Actinomycetota bacterium]
MAELVRPDGCRLYYELHGDPYAEPIVLLEGMGGDIPGWRRNIPHLAEELLVIAYDFRGNGRSDAPDEPVTMRTFVDDTVALLDHVRIDAAHIYGQSFGGMVAQELTLSHPDRVRTLILAATHCGREFFVPVRAKVPKGAPHLTLYSERFAREHPDHVAEDMRVGSQQRQRPHARRRQWDAMQDFDAGKRLWEIDRPTLVLHGTEDRLAAPANAHILAERIPRAELVLLEGAGHLYHSERAEEADAAILDFIRRHRQ